MEKLSKEDYEKIKLLRLKGKVLNRLWLISYKITLKIENLKSKNGLEKKKIIEKYR